MTMSGIRFFAFRVSGRHPEVTITDVNLTVRSNDIYTRGRRVSASATWCGKDCGMLLSPKRIDGRDHWPGFWRNTMKWLLSSIR